MPSLAAQYNQEVLEGHREALQALRELLAEETDPIERRRLANAILKTRPVKDPQAQQPSDQSKLIPGPSVATTRTASETPTPFWPSDSATPTPTPFGDQALAHPLNTTADAGPSGP